MNLLRKKVKEKQFPTWKDLEFMNIESYFIDF